MSVVDKGDVIRALRGAGFPNDPQTLGTMYAIAWFESSFRTDATNTNSNGSVDKGVWQINDKANADIVKKWGDPFDLARNAAMAYDVYKRQGFSAWATYNDRAKNPEWVNIKSQGTGIAAHFPGRITIDKGTEIAPGITSPGDTIVKPITDALSGPMKAAQEFGNKALGFLNVGLGLTVGIVLLILGIVLLARGVAGRVIGGTVKEMAKGAVKETAAPKTALTVEQRAARSLDYSDVRKRLQGEHAKAAADASRAKLRKL